MPNIAFITQGIKVSLVWFVRPSPASSPNGSASAKCRSWRHYFASSGCREGCCILQRPPPTSPGASLSFLHLNGRVCLASSARVPASSSLALSLSSPPSLARSPPLSPSSRSREPTAVVVARGDAASCRNARTALSPSVLSPFYTSRCRSVSCWRQS
jgi:hypothetical protein